MQLLGSIIGKKSVCVPLLPFLLPGGVSVFVVAETGAAIADFDMKAHAVQSGTA